jgi:hypothetical protein
MNVAIQVFAFDEPVDGFRETLSSIQDQTVPRGIKPSYEAWITPASEDDPLFTAARQEGFTPHEAPDGKLSSRNVAHNRAVDEGKDVIVSWDADAPALNDEALSNLLEQFDDPGVVAVSGLSMSRWKRDGGLSLAGVFLDMAAITEDVVFPHIPGRCSAFTADGWKRAGEFDTQLDQTSMQDVRQEEEFDFLYRLSEVGRHTFANAPVRNGLRRHLCKIPGMGDPDYCDTRGVETFQHRQDGA